MTTNKQTLTVNVIAVPVLAAAAFTALCYFAAPLLVPLVTSLTLAYVLWPAVALLRRFKVPHLLAVAIVMLIVVLLVFTAGLIIYGEVKDFAQTVPSYWMKFQTLRTTWVQEYPVLDQLVPEQVESILDQIDVGQLSVIPKYFFKITGGVLSVAGQLTLILLLTVFMLIEQKGLTHRLRVAFGSEQEHATGEIINEISRQIAGYVWVRFITTLGLTIIFTVGLLIGGVNYAYIWGPLAGLLNLVPYVGSIVGAFPPMIIAAVEAGSFVPMIWVFAFFMIVQFLESNLITPKLVGDELNISLLAQLLATIFWGWLWGAVGILLAVPITAAIKVICDNIDSLKPIGVLLSGDR
jgi:predicted PurR-regulated permease PerM